MKLCIYADPHITKYPPGLQDLRQSCLMEVFYFIYKTAHQEQCSMCVCLGDFFHSSKLLARDVIPMNQLVSLMKNYPDISTVILTGNHDKDSLNDNLLRVLDPYKEIILVDTSWSSENCLFVANGQLGSIPPEELGSADYIFTHEDYIGSILNSSGIKSPGGYDQRKLSLRKTCRVYNGHIHKSGVVGQVINVGSVNPIAFGELTLGEYPQIIILDTETRESKSISITMGLMPITVSEGDLESVKIYDPSRIRLRIQYSGDKPVESEELSKFASLEYQRVLPKSSTSLYSEEEKSVEDVVVNVPTYVDKMLERDTTLTEEYRDSIRSESHQLMEGSST